MVTIPPMTTAFLAVVYSCLTELWAHNLLRCHFDVDWQRSTPDEQRQVARFALSEITGDDRVPAADSGIALNRCRSSGLHLRV